MAAGSCAKSRRWIVRIGILFSIDRWRDPHPLRVRSDVVRSVLWRSGETADFNNGAPRVRIPDGLLQSGAPPGRARRDIAAMSGSPTQTDTFADDDRVHRRGAERGPFGNDSEWRVIRFEGDNVVGARIMRY